jgi:hypothetical protein
VKSRYPNRSVLSILTGEEKTDSSSELPVGIKESYPILFVYVKAVPDFMKGEKYYWLDKEAKPSSLWPELGIRHWLAFGNDERISAEYEALLANGFLDIGKYRLVLPDVSRGVEAWVDPNALEDLKAETLRITDRGRLPPLFLHEENLAALSGYRPDNKNIQPVKPAGFFPPDFLFNRISQNIIGYRERRIPDLSFRGVRTTTVVGKGSSELIGFYQQNFMGDESLVAIARKAEGEEIGRSSISPDSGLFKMTLSEPTMNGVLQVERKGIMLYGKSYTLLQGINGTIDVVQKTFKDTYDREFQLKSKGLIRPNNILSSSWYGPFFADDKTANIQLSDKFKELFDYLGPSVLIADPYFIGPFRKDDSAGTLTLSKCQVAFLAALLRSVVDGAIKELYILGLNSRANQAEGRDETTNLTKKEDRFINYEKVILHSFESNQLQSFRKDFRMEFLNNKRDMHGRYWFGMSNEGGIRALNKCVIMTNSIGNISEVDFMPVLEERQLRELTERNLAFFKNSDSELVI